jgi:signal transduction histidine kinase
MLHTLLSLCIIYFVSLVPFFGYLPVHHFIFPERSAAYYSDISYYYELTGLTAVYFVVWFFASNITDSLKLHEGRLQAKIEELIEMDEQKTRYMLVTTHELKAPFSSIQSYVNVLLEGYAGDLSEKVHEILWKIKARCITLMRMITEMIQLANLSSMADRKEEVVMKKTDIVRVMGDAARSVSEAARAKEVRIIWPEDRICVIDANREQIDILFNNILSNAVNYCYPKTEIEIAVDDKPDKAVVSVADKGIGIKKENLEKVFLEYFRTEEAVGINRNSTGLGLSIARQIMGIHGGRIWIESEEKVGTTVFMGFPKRE